MLEVEARNFFEQVRFVSDKDVPIMRAATMEKGRGRIEKRNVCVTNDLESHVSHQRVLDSHLAVFQVNIAQNLSNLDQNSDKSKIK